MQRRATACFRRSPCAVTYQHACAYVPACVRSHDLPARAHLPQPVICAKGNVHSDTFASSLNVAAKSGLQTQSPAAKDADTRVGRKVFPFENTSLIILSFRSTTMLSPMDWALC
eukprot:4172203-Pleurochrysis_carterae.AAC.3